MGQPTDVITLAQARALVEEWREVLWDPVTRAEVWADVTEIFRSNRCAALAAGHFFLEQAVRLGSAHDITVLEQYHILKVGGTNPTAALDSGADDFFCNNVHMLCVYMHIYNGLYILAYIRHNFVGSLILLGSYYLQHMKNMCVNAGHVKSDGAVNVGLTEP